MTKRTPGWIAAIALVMATTARAQESASGRALTVCLTFSEGFELAAAASLKSGILAETTRIWQPLGVAVGVPEDFENACDRRILVKSGPRSRSRRHVPRNRASPGCLSPQGARAGSCSSG